MKFFLLVVALAVCVRADAAAEDGTVATVADAAAAGPINDRLNEFRAELTAVKDEVKEAQHQEVEQLKKMREKARLRAEAAMERGKAIHARLEALAKAGKEARAERERMGKAAGDRARSVRAGVDKLRGHVSAVSK